MKPIHPSKLDQAIEDFLTCFPFFSDLSDEEFNIVADLIGIYQMEPNEVLLKEGDKTQGVYFILDGKMNILRESVSGKTPGVENVVIRKLEAGSSIAELVFLADLPTPFTVKSLTQSHVVALTKEGFDSIVENHPRVGIKLVLGLCKMASKNLLPLPGIMAEYAHLASETK